MNIEGHDRVTWFLFPIVALSGYWYLGITGFLIGASFLFSGLMFNGDLDIHSNVYRRWLFLKWIWWPYRYFGHRSIWTHGPLIGTITRLLWVGVPLSGLCYYIGGMELLGLIVTSREFLEVLIGLELGSMSHSVCDFIYSGGKRLF